jgi:serine/threonine-protein kinase RsbW
MENASFTIKVRAAPEEVMRVVEHLQEFCHARGVGEQAIYALMLSLEEMASNIVNHAYQRDPQQSFHVSVQHAGDRVIVELRDLGKAFDPLQVSDPETNEDPDDRPEGGWGIQLVRHSMDELHYVREGDENVFRMIKHLKPDRI